jgi:hypothetical protein
MKMQVDKKEAKKHVRIAVVVGGYEEIKKRLSG